MSSKNLYFVGQTEYSAWAGIILIDTLWDYSVEDEVVGGLTRLGLDPTTIKYVLVSHGHIEASEGWREVPPRRRVGGHGLQLHDDAGQASEVLVRDVQ